jgi:quercetin dioxygenase-like cupin family protein
MLSPIVVLPNDGLANAIRSAIHLFKLTAKETGGAFSIMEASLEPGLLVPPHMHTREDELFYIMEGEAGFRIGDQEFQAPTGSYVFAPRGIPHAVWNPGTHTHKVMGVIMPGGAEKFFDEIAVTVNQHGVPDAAQIVAIHNRHGMTSVMEWVPELTAKYHLKLLGQP